MKTQPSRKDTLVFKNFLFHYLFALGFFLTLGSAHILYKKIKHNRAYKKTWKNLASGNFKINYEPLFNG